MPELGARSSFNILHYTIWLELTPPLFASAMISLSNRKEFTSLAVSVRRRDGLLFEAGYPAYTLACLAPRIT